MKRLLLLVALMSLSSCTSSPAPIPTLTKTATRLSTVPLPTKSLTATPTLKSTIELPNHRTTQPPNHPTTQPPNRRPTDQPTIQPSDPVLVGAGDIAVCDARGDEATAEILDKIAGTVFTLGDNVYPNGTLQEFQTCYETSWGRHKARTRPVPGNHDYNTAGARGYYEYFGANAGDPKRGFYSYDLGAWHIIVLNSQVDTAEHSAQVKWLREDLTAHAARCVVAMWHKPLFTSGPHGRDGSGDRTRALWDVLYENNADVILNGHDHDYERFAPQDPNGTRDDARGIRQFVVGTGGASPYTFGEPKPNSEKRITGPFGVLKLTLHATSYDWEFVSIAPLLFSDSGRGECN